MSEFIERAVDFEPLPEEERSGKDQGDGRTLEGYAAVFDQDTEINSWEGHFKERMVRGAFRKTLKERTPVCQFDHGHDSRFGNLPIGKFTLLKEDKHGLRVEARLFDHAEPIREAIAEGAVTGMSFRFKVVRDSWADDKGNPITDRNELMDKLYNAKKGDKPLQRTIKEVKLMEAGPVVFPAYPQTTVGVRSMTDDQRKRAIEDLTSGFTAEDVPEVTDEDVEREREAAGTSLREVMDELGISDEEIVEYLRGENPFAAKKAKGKGDAPADDDKACSCDKVKGDHKVSDHPKKTSSGKGEAKPTEKKSEDDTSSAPEAGDDAAEPRSEDPNDAAQAGTSTGMTKNARERAIRLLDI
jgi:HK97 family phage prohead protease